MPNIRIQTHFEVKPDIFRELAAAIDEVFKKRGIMHTDTMHTRFEQYAIGSEVVAPGDARCRTIIHVEMGSGRQREVIAEIVKGITKAAAEILKIDIDNIDLYLREMPPQTYYVGGKPFSAPHPKRDPA